MQFEQHWLADQEKRAALWTRLWDVLNRRKVTVTVNGEIQAQVCSSDRRSSDEKFRLG